MIERYRHDALIFFSDLADRFRLFWNARRHMRELRLADLERIQAKREAEAAREAAMSLRQYVKVLNEELDRWTGTASKAASRMFPTASVDETPSPARLVTLKTITVPLQPLHMVLGEEQSALTEHASFRRRWAEKFARDAVGLIRDVVEKALERHDAGRMAA